MNNEKTLVENILSDVLSYECDSIKSGKTIRITIFNKRKDSTEVGKREFRDFDKAIEFLKTRKIIALAENSRRKKHG